MDTQFSKLELAKQLYEKVGNDFDVLKKTLIILSDDKYIPILAQIGNKYITSIDDGIINYTKSQKDYKISRIENINSIPIKYCDMNDMELLYNILQFLLVNNKIEE